VRELLQDVVPDAHPVRLRALAAGAAALVVGAALSLPVTVSGLGDPVALCGP
jgi:hypothetical protein